MYLSSKLNECHEYKIGNTILTSVSLQKDLGIFIDRDLTFKPHREHVQKSCFRMLGVINKNFRYHTKEFLLKMYSTFVLPRLNYCSTIWNPVQITDILEIERVQRRATGTFRIFNDRNLTYESRLVKLNMQPLYVLRARIDILMIHKF